MRNAEEILQNLGLDRLEFYTSDHYRIVLKAINEARKEAIEECAKNVRLKYDKDAVGGVTINKESILSLIKELK